MRRDGFFLHVVPAILYVAAIFYAGSIPNPPTLHLDFSAQDKLLHFGAFCGMELTLVRAVRWAQPKYSFERQLLLSVVLTSAIGALLEFWQAFLPERSAELLDWVADTVGAGVGSGLLWLVFGRMLRSSKAQ
jgi:VanZ family protein